MTSLLTSPRPPAAAADRGGRVAAGSAAVDLVGVGALTALLRLPLVLASKPLSYDDGVYGASVVAIRGGARQYHDVFSGQGPLYLPLLRLGDLLGLQARWAPRVSGVLAAVLLSVVAAWMVGRVAGRAAGLATGVLLATSGQLVATFGSIEADALVVAAGTVAVGLALAGRGPLAVGLAAGVALSIKHLMAGPPIIAALLALWVLRGRRRGAGGAATAAGIALATTVVCSLPWGLATVWDHSVTYHLEARATGTVSGNLDGLRRQLLQRDGAVLLVLLLAAAGLVAVAGRRRAVLGDLVASPRTDAGTPAGPVSTLRARRGAIRAFRRVGGVARKDDDEGRAGPLSRRRTPRAASSGRRNAEVVPRRALSDAGRPPTRVPGPGERTVTLAGREPAAAATARATVLAAVVWTAAALVLVVMHRPLFSQHATALVVPLCVLAGLARPWWPALGVALALQVPGQLHDVGWRASVLDAAPPTSTYIADLQTFVPEGALVLSDDPGVLWWAGRATPPELIDTSFVRIEAARLAAADVEAAATTPGTCALLAVSGRFARFGPLDLAGYKVVREYGNGRQLWIRAACDPSS